MKIDQDSSLLGLFTFRDLETVMTDNRQLGNRPPSMTAYHGMSRHDLQAELRDFFHSADFHAEVNKAVKSSIDDLYSNVQRIEQKVNTPDDIVDSWSKYWTDKFAKQQNELNSLRAKIVYQQTHVSRSTRL